MLFNTLLFAKFFALAYAIYLLVGLRSLRWQNLVLLAANYVFYCYWDWRFSALLVFLTLFNYFAGIKIGESSSPSAKKSFLVLSVGGNLAVLGFFKYFGFFAEGLSLTLNILLPLGISFFTFQVMSYALDIHRGLLKPTRNLIDFACFVSFFPNLVAGPIERARNLLPQIAFRRVITRERVYEGSWLIFLGLYKKIFIADNLARLTGKVFASPGSYSGLELLLQSYVFAFQLYMDFSGYSDMARGIAKLLGFEIMMNFRFPYFSRNLMELWRRWHISLTTWIKEYLFYPLALAKFFGKTLNASIVILITWTLMGIWHGANPKFVLWGVYHGALLILYNFLKPYLNWLRPKQGLSSRAWSVASVVLTFNLFCAGLLCFAADSMNDVIEIVRRVLLDFRPHGQPDPALIFLVGLVLLPVMALEYFQYKKDDEFLVFRWPFWSRAAVYYLMFYSIIFFGVFSARQYYYFQF